MFICNHCPVCSWIRPELARRVKEYQEKGIAFLGIMPHELRVTPMNGPVEMRCEIKAFNYSFPYCFDGDVQEASRAIGAVTTPDIFVYDRDLCLVYRGPFDDTRPPNMGQFQPPKEIFMGGVRRGAAPDGGYLRAACDALVAGGGLALPGKIKQYASEGCSIKWLPDKQPAYSKP